MRIGDNGHTTHADIKVSYFEDMSSLIYES